MMGEKRESLFFTSSTSSLVELSQRDKIFDEAFK